MLVHSRGSFQKFSKDPKSTADHSKSFMYVIFHSHYSLTQACIFLKSTQSPIFKWNILHSWIKVAALHQHYHSKFEVIFNARYSQAKSWNEWKLFTIQYGFCEDLFLNEDGIVSDVTKLKTHLYLLLINNLVKLTFFLL